MEKTFVVIGHIDTGKSTLCGHLLYISGYINDHEMNKIKEKAKIDKMERWIWARILDIYDEEMNRGKTHEFNEIKFSYNNHNYKLVDTPGHQGFVRSMIQGISRNIDIAVVIISVTENEFLSSFENGMLKEHLILAKAAGLTNLVVLLNKMDSIKWDEKIYNERKNKIKEFLKWINWDTPHFIPISAFEGEGIINIQNTKEWYNGMSFIDCLEKIEINSKDINETDKILSNTIIIKTTILNTKVKITDKEGEILKESIICKGFQCIGHFKDIEKEVTFIKILGDKKFLKSGNKSQCILGLGQPIKVYNNMRIILRANDNTIGFGRIYKILPYTQK